MEIIIGETAGFCFGVKNAVTKARRGSRKGQEHKLLRRIST